MPRRIARQLARPHGIAGRQVAMQMAVVNRQMIASAIDLLAVGEDDVALEVGFGRGDGLLVLADKARRGRVLGVDHAALMLRVARRRLKAHISAGQVELHQASVDQIPIADRVVNRVLAVNTTTYWPDVSGGFGELHRVTADGARLVVSARSPDSLVKVGVSGVGVNLHRADDLTAVAVGVGFAIDDVVHATDRLGDYFHVVLERRPAR